MHAVFAILLLAESEWLVTITNRSINKSPLVIAIAIANKNASSNNADIPNDLVKETVANGRKRPVPEPTIASLIRMSIKPKNKNGISQIVAMYFPTGWWLE